MAILLFKLRQVPDDEAGDIRTLLQENHISFYETTAGSWGVSMPGIWLHDDAQENTARKLIQAYQQERQTKARSAYAELKSRGEQRTMLHLIMESPLRFLLLLAAALFILYISLTPFFDLPG